MDKRTARKIRAVLSERFPGADIVVEPRDDGALVVIGVPRGLGSAKDMIRLSIGNGHSVVLRQLLTGYAT